MSGGFVQLCLCLINDSFGEKCDQGHARSIYFQQSLTHLGAWLNTCSALVSSPVNCASMSSATICLLGYLYLQNSRTTAVLVYIFYPSIRPSV